MAATDQTYRNQRRLDVAFGVACVLMLVSVVWMFAQDYNREFKHVQREFRDVDEALTQRTMLEKMPAPADLERASQEVMAARDRVKQIKADNAGPMKTLLGQRARQEAKVQQVKADYDSQTSLLN